MGNITIKGKVAKIRYVGNNNWTAFSIKLSSPFKEKYGDYINASGVFEDGSLAEKVEGSFTGKFSVDDKFGAKIDVTDYEIEDSINNIVAVLMTVDGVGKKKATLIAETLGLDTFEIIRFNPEKLKEIKGINDKITERILASVEEIMEKRKIYELVPQITSNQVDKLVSKYGSYEDAAKVLKEDPYVLIKDINGFGFSRVDKMALAMGISKYSVQRVKAGIIYALENATSDGHCYLTANELEKAALEVLNPFILKVDDKGFEKEFWENIKNWSNSRIQFINRYAAFLSEEDIEYIDTFVEDYKIFISLMVEALKEEKLSSANEDGEIVFDSSAIYRRRYFDAENSVAKIIINLVDKKPIYNKTAFDIKKICEEPNFLTNKLTFEQQSAVVSALTNRISVITGGAGVGKTTIIKAIIKCWETSGRKDNIVLCAPTGQAAKRMSETSDNHEARTIQSYTARKEDILNSLVIVDESSMIDICLMDNFLSLTKNCQIVFVGDINQLPSIGPGLVLKDMIDSGVVPVVRLSHTFRNEGSIVENSNLINEGKVFKYMTLDDSFVYIEAKKENEVDEHPIVKKILELKKEMRKKYNEEDIKVISPLRTRTKCGVDNLNSILKKQYYELEGIAKPTHIDGTNFHVGDRILNIKNNAQKNVVNGDAGKIISYDDDKNTFLVRMDIGNIYYENGIKKEKERIVEYKTNEKDMLDLGYAQTVHKAQGSEYKVVIFVATTEHYVMLKRNLLYTAITRAKEKIYLIGQEKAFNLAVFNIDDKKRNTRLKERLRSR